MKHELTFSIENTVEDLRVWLIEYH